MSDVGVILQQQLALISRTVDSYRQSLQPAGLHASLRPAYARRSIGHSPPDTEAPSRVRIRGITRGRAAAYLFLLASTRGPWSPGVGLVLLDHGPVSSPPDKWKYRVAVVGGDHPGGLGGGGGRQAGGAGRVAWSGRVQPVTNQLPSRIALLRRGSRRREIEKYGRAQHKILQLVCSVTPRR